MDWQHEFEMERIERDQKIEEAFKLVVSNLSKDEAWRDTIYRGLWGLGKVLEPCHYVKFSKIQEMKSISQPRLPIEI
jgi:hypothetical protein